jgi:hypothetical protein
MLALVLLQVLQELTGLTLNDRLVIAISSITKMFVGELIETGEQAAAARKPALEMTVGCFASGSGSCTALSTAKMRGRVCTY